MRNGTGYIVNKITNNEKIIAWSSGVVAAESPRLYEVNDVETRPQLVCCGGDEYYWVNKVYPGEIITCGNSQWKVLAAYNNRIMLGDAHGGAIEHTMEAGDLAFMQKIPVFSDDIFTREQHSVRRVFTEKTVEYISCDGRFIH